MGDKELRRLFIACMAIWSKYAVLQPQRIGTEAQHNRVIISFNHEMRSRLYMWYHVIREVTDISKQNEMLSLSLYMIAHILRAIMRHVKSRDTERADGESISGAECDATIDRHFLGHMMICVNRLMDPLRAINREMEMSTDCSDALCMIGVVMS